MSLSSTLHLPDCTPPPSPRSSSPRSSISYFSPTYNSLDSLEPKSIGPDSLLALQAAVKRDGNSTGSVPIGWKPPLLMLADKCPFSPGAVVWFSDTLLLQACRIITVHFSEGIKMS